MAEFMDLVTDLKAKGETFAIATVVRTVAATAAKAAPKALIRTDGSTVPPGVVLPFPV